MPINAFGGGPGSGKTYGVVEHVILPAVSKGRFILTNIEGLNVDAIYEYVASQAPKGKIVCIGHIRRCDRDAPSLPEFFPGQDALDQAMPVPDPEYPRVWGGDLVVVDEATRYWVQGQKVDPRHAYFFREHRHFANVVGHTCDLVVIDPDITMLARALKGKIELSSVTHKPKVIGLNRYVVNLYAGARINGKAQSTQGPYPFRKEIYSLYKSYSHENAKEQAIDKRQNLLKNPKIVGGFVAACLMFGLCVWGITHLYGSYREKAIKPVAASSPAGGSHRGNDGASSPGAPARAAPARSDISSNLRVVGTASFGGQSYVLVRDLESGALRYENPAAFVGAGSLMVGNVEGQRVTTWSGRAPAPSSAPVGGAK